MTRYEDNKFLNTINWINLTRGNGKTRITYELFRLFMKQKYDIEMPEWDIQEQLCDIEIMGGKEW